MSTHPSPVGFQFVVKFVWACAVEYNANSVTTVIFKSLEHILKEDGERIERVEVLGGPGSWVGIVEKINTNGNWMRQKCTLWTLVSRSRVPLVIYGDNCPCRER